MKFFKRKSEKSLEKEHSSRGSSPSKGGTLDKQPSRPPPKRSNSSTREVSGVMPGSLQRSSVQSMPPLPSERELSQRFSTLMDARGLKGAQREQMDNLPPDTKWLLICQEGIATKQDETMAPEEAARLTAEASSGATEFDRVAVLLGSQPVRWVAAFISAGGFKHLLNVLVRKVRAMKTGAPNQADVDLVCSGIRCLKAVMNSHLEPSIEAINETKGVAGTLLVCVQLVPPRLASALLEMLAAISVATDQGHKALRKPLIASNFLSYVSNDLLANSASGGPQMQVAAMTFVNAVLSGYGESGRREKFVKALQSSGVSTRVEELKESFACEDTTVVVHMQMQLDIFKEAVITDNDEEEGDGSSPVTDSTVSDATPVKSGVSKGVSAARRGDSLSRAGSRKRGAAGASRVASSQLTIDRKGNSPEALVRQLSESTRGTVADRALPKVIQSLSAMRTEGSMAAATWALLGAFVQVVSYIPEPEDGVAAPGELVNAACHALAKEFVVPLKPSETEEKDDNTAVEDPAALKAKLEETQSTLANVREKAENLESELKEVQSEKEKAVQDSVEFQMEAQEEADRLQKELETAKAELEATQAKLASAAESGDVTPRTAGGRSRAGAVNESDPSMELEKLRAEVADLKAQLEVAKKPTLELPPKPADASVPDDKPAEDNATEDNAKEENAAQTEPLVEGIDTGTVRKPARAVPDAAETAVAETEALKARIAELEKQLEESKKAADPGDAPITGGPPPPPAPDAGDAPITGGPPPPPAPGAGNAPVTGGPPPPPMPGGGGAPPPPPMPGVAPPPMPGKTTAVPKKPVIKPGVKMRAFNWTKVPPRKVEGTVWSKLDDGKVKVDKKALESLFGSDASTAKPKKAVASPSAKSKADDVIRVVEPRRSQNLIIMLSRFKNQSYAQIREAVEKLDTTVLTADTIKALRHFTPQPDEIEALKEHTSNVQRLGKAEQFLLEMSKVPRLEERLDAAIFYVGFQQRFGMLQQETHILRTAGKEVKDNKKLQKLLEIVLAIGNYVNGSTFRGGAFGFKLSSLKKMLEVRQNGSRGTLMHYVVDFVEGKHKDLLSFAEDMPSLPAAARMTPLAQMTADLNKLVSGLSSIEKEISQSDDKDRFVKLMEKFHDTASGRVDKLKKAFEGLQSNFKELLTFYAEDASTDTETFFGSLQRFVQSFNQARHDKKVWAQQDAAAKTSAERMKKLGIKTVGPKGGPMPSKLNPFAGVEKGSLDSMIAHLKTGTDQRLHRKSFRARENK